MSPSADRYHAIVIGGGPAGATAALVIARAGLRVLVLDRVTHPRFHIGESFVPRNRTLLEELGLVDRFEALTHTVKHGAEFAMGDMQAVREFRFDAGLPCGETVAWNIERAPYDAMLLNAARDAGAEVRENVAALAVPTLREGDVRVETDRGNFTASYVLDATGQQTFLGRQLKTRRVLEHHQKVAYFGHFKNVYRHEGERAGIPFFAVCDEGWFWAIPIDPVRTSIGLVFDAAAAKQADSPPTQMLRWAIARCPAMRERTRHAVFPDQNGVCADFSYRCEPYAGPGYFLVGDAAAFVDPIFSTGVCLGMMHARLAAESVIALLRDPRADAERLRREYIAYLRSTTAEFFNLIDLYYQHPFREMFLHGLGPFQIPQAVISLLAGHVFPRPPFKLRWRMRLFEQLIKVQRHVALVPRLKPFSLMKSAPSPIEEDARTAPHTTPATPTIPAAQPVGAGA